MKYLAPTLALYVCLCGCKEQPPAETQVMVVIDAEPAVREQIVDIDLSVKSGSGDARDWSSRFEASLTPGSDPIAWPLEIALVPQGGDTSRNYAVLATARGASGGMLAQVRAISGYVEGRSLSLPLVFDGACLARDRLCTETFTCRAGDCVDPYVPPSELLPFERGSRPGDGVSGASAGGAGDTGGSGGASDTGGSGGAGGTMMVEPGPDGSVSECEGPVEACMPGPTVECGEECEGCPENFLRLESGACAPLLLGLGLSRGEIVPPLNAVDTSYRVELPLLVESLTFTPVVAEGVTFETSGPSIAVGEDATFATRSVPLGESTVLLSLRADGHESRRYTFTIGRNGQERTYLKASNTGAGDTFGHAVAIDGSAIAVGAPLEDSSTADAARQNNLRMNSGAAYVFERQGASFAEVAYLKASEIEEDAELGTALALEGDTLVVGAPGERAGGSVYVYRRSAAGAWSQEAKLKPSSSHEGRRFGASLALHGELLAVGAPADDTFSLDGGAAFVYARSGTSWTEVAVAGSLRAAPAIWMGSSVALQGDRLFIGATGESTDVYPRGGAYVFERTAGGYEERQKIYEADVGQLDFFGDSVAVLGDTLAIGAFGASGSAAGNGFVYVYREGSEGYQLEQRLGASNPSTDAHLGVRVVLRDDVIITGAPDEDSGARGINGDLAATGRADSGAVYMFVRDGTRWSQLALIKSLEPGAGDRYGFSVAADEDTLVVGAPGESSGVTGVDGDTLDTTAANSGAVYVIR